jgi:hypothetical protein
MRVLIREYDDGKLEVVSDAGIIDAKEAPHKPRFFAASGQKPGYDSGSIPQWLESILWQKSDIEESSIQPGQTPIRRPTIRQQALWDAVQETRGQGLSLRAIAKLFHMSRKTVKRYKSSVSPPLYNTEQRTKLTTT